MKQILIFAMAVICATFTACASEPEPGQPDNNNRVLTVYFSATGTTEGIAEKIHIAAGGDIVRIEPVEAYTSADLDYNSDCRANREQNDPSARPEIKTELPDMADYDVIYLGYPIWWGKAPKIIYTLLESADFSDKTIIPFCTSGSSGISGSESDLHAIVPDAIWEDGKRFASNTSQAAITEWVNSVMPEINNNMESYKMYITVNGTTMTAIMVANSSTAALRELLEKDDLTIDMSDYGNFEKVGELPESLPQNNEQITTFPGDLILYLGKNLVIYYDTNSWNFTRLGKIDNLSQDQLKAILGSGDCTAKLSLKSASITGVTTDSKAKTKSFRPDGSLADANTKGVVVETYGNTIKKTYRR